jgi:hypothetical protein
LLKISVPRAMAAEVSSHELSMANIMGSFNIAKLIKTLSPK